MVDSKDNSTKKVISNFATETKKRVDHGTKTFKENAYSSQ